MVGPFELPNRLAMAPMSGVSTLAARLIALDAGAGLVVTETLSARALIRGTDAAKQKLSTGHGEELRAVQLFGSDPSMLGEACERLVDQGVRWIDLNVGCPVKKFIRQGAGAALLQEPRLLARILREMRRHTPEVLSLKIRSGWDAAHKNAPSIAAMAAAEGIDLLSVHGRTRAQQYRGDSDPEIIAEVVAAVPTLPVFANGDVTRVEDIAPLVQRTGAAGVMIGRGAVGNPWIFEQALLAGGKLAAPSASARLATMERHVELVSRTTLCPGSRLRELQRYVTAYSKGLPGGKRFRRAALGVDDPETLIELGRDFLGSLETREAA